MKIHKKVYSLAIILPFLLMFSFSCANTSGSSEQEEVFFDDGHKTPAKDKDEVVFDDNFFQDEQDETKINNQKAREITQIAKDGSSIDVTYDGFGNKTETRTFYGNPLLNLIMLRTGVDGTKQVFVYAQNGEIKKLPEEMLDKILTAPPNELANAAGIYKGISETPEFTQNNQPTTYTSLKPLPGSEYPTRNQQVEQTESSDETNQSGENGEKPASVENKNGGKSSVKPAAQLESDKKSDGD